MTPACGTCRHAEPTVIEGDGPGLLCRRNPPQVISLGDPDHFAVQWPPVGENDWCGEHTPREDTP